MSRDVGRLGMPREKVLDTVVKVRETTLNPVGMTEVRKRFIRTG